MAKFGDALLLIAVVTPLVHCDESTVLLKYKNKSYFIERDLRLSWFGALHSCKRRNMELASVNSLDEQEFLVNYIKEEFIEQYYWLAGNDLEFNDTNQFFWANTGQRMDFAKWSGYNPDNWQGKENCVHMFYDGSGAWNDGDCTVKMNFICETRPRDGWIVRM